MLVIISETGSVKQSSNRTKVELKFLCNPEGSEVKPPSNRTKVELKSELSEEAKEIAIQLLIALK